MVLLDLLNNLYEKTTTVVKAQLFFLPLLITLFIIQNIDLNSKLLDYSKIEFSRENKNYDSNKILKSIQNFADENHIDINSVNLKEKELFLTLVLQEKTVLKAIEFLENIDEYSNIKGFSLSESKEEFFTLKVDIDFSKRYIKSLNKTHINDIAEKKDIKLKLIAIVANRVKINNRWYRKNQQIDKYVLTHIRSSSVVLKSQSNILVLRIKDEYIK